MKKGIYKRLLFASITFLMLGYFMLACNKQYKNELQQFGDYSDTSSLIKHSKKVLYIIIDGANGQVMKNLKLTNINKLASTGTYTWNSLSGIRAQDSSIEASWSNLMTGVNSDIVNVTNTFDDNKFDQYPSFISRLKSNVEDSFKISVSSTSSDFDKYFASPADEHKVFASDAETAGEIVSQVKGDNDVVVGEFNSAYKTGLETTFDSSSEEYINALKNIDSYIGTIVNSLKSRSRYKDERWMIIVSSTSNLTSNKSSGADPSLYSDNQLNTFTVISNPQFNESYIDKPSDTRGTVAYQTAALRFRGDFGTNNDGNRVSVTDTKQLYNCPPGDSLTVEAKIKINPTSSGSFSYYYPPFISKIQSRYGTYSGWSFFRTGNNIAFFVGLGSSKIEIDGNVPITDNAWHTIAGRIAWNGTTLNTSLFVDGVTAGTGTAANLSLLSTMINNTYPLVIGYWPTVFTTQFLDSYIKDVRIWNVALTDAQIASYSCFPSDLLPSDLPLNRLVGDFRINQEDGNSVVKDYSSNKQDGVYDVASSGKMEWKTFDEVSNAICPSATDDFYNASIKGVDLPYEIFTWLGIKIESSWNLDGKFWQPSLNTD